MTDWNPTKDFLLLTVELLPERTEGGIFIPEQSRRDLNEGVICKIGPDALLQIGDRVIFTLNSEFRLKDTDTGEEFAAVSEANVILYKAAKSSLKPAPINFTGKKLNP